MKNIIKTFLSLTLVLFLGLNIANAADPQEIEMTPGGQKAAIIHIFNANNIPVYLIEKDIDQTLPQFKKNKNWTLNIIFKHAEPQKIKDDSKLTKYLNTKKENVWAEAQSFSYNHKTKIITINNLSYYNEKGQIIADISDGVKATPVEDRQISLANNQQSQAFFDAIANYLESRLKEAK
ncbi:hypothetical protein LJC10_05815 [Selenomonadales bacterium OttesenSCG-928-I06]|nr:hypothetical protein [Selenomonadales bacterium OttesenSCG-928-I06]